MREIVIGVRNQNARLAQDVARLKRENTTIKASFYESETERAKVAEVALELEAARALVESYEVYLAAHNLLRPAQLFVASRARLADRRAAFTPTADPTPLQTEDTP